ncbi:unnamed protein product [Prorocentrum cordatum]|uniref:Uncharacterized protein n=1 Tax=Prorocentrum cordatum TaxID=2364126 RepID=A0ABN9VLW7_9DINO|nr:unnamed protein product [Polarella glacialis]
MPHVRSLASRCLRRARACQLGWVRPNCPLPLVLEGVVARDTVLHAELDAQANKLLTALLHPSDSCPKVDSVALRGFSSAIDAGVQVDEVEYPSQSIRVLSSDAGVQVDEVHCPFQSIRVSSIDAEVQVHSQSIRVSSMGAGVQTQFTCEDACVQTQFTSMDAGVHTQFTLKDACVQTQLTFQDAVKTWIDSTAQKGFTGQIALQYLIQGLELFVDLMTEPMTIPKHHVSFWFHTLFNLTDHVQSFLGELLGCLKSHRFVTGKMDRAEEARFKAPGYIVDCFSFVPDGLFESASRADPRRLAADTRRLQQMWEPQELRITSPRGRIAFPSGSSSVRVASDVIAKTGHQKLVPESSQSIRVSPDNGGSSRGSRKGRGKGKR